MAKRFTKKERKLPDLTNRPLQLYNMYPRRYQKEGDVFPAMTQDLERVAGMGYRAVYIPPFTEVGHYPKSDGRVGSLYATRDLRNVNAMLFGNETGPLFTKRNGKPTPTKLGRKVVAFCDKSRELGMVPMFDLVQGHLSPDSPYIEEARKESINIVKRHEETGNTVIHGLNERHEVMEGHENPRDVWDDVADLNFEDENAKQFILDKILIPHVEDMATLGFRGIRIDSAYRIPKDVQKAVLDAFKAKCEELDGSHYVAPPILGETLDPEGNPAELEGLITHNYASTYVFPKRDEVAGLNLFDPKTINNSNHGLNKDTVRKQDDSNSLSMAPTSTHDEPPLLSKLEEQIGDIINNHPENKNLPDEEKAKAYREHITRASRIKIAFSAFFSPGGYMLCSGDEFLSQLRHSVFDGEVVAADKPIEAAGQHRLSQDEVDELLEEAQKDNFAEYTIEGQTYRFVRRELYDKPFWKYGPEEKRESRERLVLLPRQLSIPDRVKRKAFFDPGLPEFIKQINAALELCKDTSPDCHAKFHFSQKDPDLVFFTRYKGPRGGERKFMEIALVNVSPSKDKSVEITQEVLNYIEEQTGLTQAQISGNIVDVGNIEYNAPGLDTRKERPAGASMGK